MQEDWEEDELVLLTPEEREEREEALEMRIPVRDEEKERNRAAAQEFGRARREAELAVQTGPSPTGATSIAPEGTSAGAITPRERPDGHEGGESAQEDPARTVSTPVPDPEVVRTNMNAPSLGQMLRQTADEKAQLRNQLRQMQDRMASLKTRAEMLTFSRPAEGGDIATNMGRKPVVEKEVEEVDEEDENDEKDSSGRKYKKIGKASGRKAGFAEEVKKQKETRKNLKKKTQGWAVLPILKKNKGHRREVGNV